MLSQSSNVGPIWLTQVSTPPRHISVPRSHRPTSVPVVHGPPVGTDSSNRPSQSSSRLLQTSVWPPTEPTSPTQSIAPLMQRLTPAVHSPVLVPHSAPPPGSPSSVRPLQLL